MGTKRSTWLAVAAGLAMGLSGASGAPLGNGFTFQGELKNTGVIAAGPVDLRFRLFDSVAAGSQIGGQLTRSSVGLLDGRFTVGDLDFGAGAFAGEERFLEVDVAVAGSGAFTTLSPRFKLNAAPHAVFALNAGNASLAASALALNGQPASFYTNAANMSSGVLPNARLSGIYSGSILFTNGANSFAGNGSGITGLNASNISSGTLPSARLSGVYSNALTLNNATNAISGVFTGNGAGLTALNATNLASGTVPDARLSSAVALLAGTQTFTGAKTFSASSVFNGTVGIGTGAPQDLLHIFGGDAGTTTANSGSRVIIEDDTAAYLNFLTPATIENGILFGLQGNAASGGIMYNATANPNGFQFRTNGNLTRMVLDDAGFLGIGTTAPTAPLTVTGSTPEVARITHPANGSVLINSAGDASLNLGASGVHKWKITNDISGSGGNALTIVNEFSVGRFMLTQGGAINFVNGNFDVGGTLTANVKSFKIDHPLDPENKYLMHTCVESDEMATFYTGNTTTDADGYAIVSFPDWFHALNHDFRYQLTVVDETGDDFIFAKVARKLENGRFTIRTSKPHVEVSWLVTGIRHDAYATHAPTQVVVEKAPEHKGKYLWPQAFGLDDTRGMMPPKAAPAAHDPR